MDKQTKIIATIGPASDSVETIRKMYEGGMNVARLNFSHGSYEYFEKIIANIREVSDEIAILLDTKGPEIRTGSIAGGKVMLLDNQEIEFTNEDIEGDNAKVSIFYKSLNNLKKGNMILIDDGLIEAEVIKVEKNSVKCKVINGGELGSKKTVSIRGHNVDIPFLSDKDKEDILFGIHHDLDFVAASFVRTEDEVLELRKFLEEKNSKMRVISKIEHAESVKNIEKIISVSQGVMVARGDLGVEMPLERVPVIQRDIIKRCNELGRPVIVATQMLESMKDNPRPTRAEVADVAAAIIQGTDAIMLSGETASGKYPDKAVKMMTKIAKQYDPLVESRIIDNISDIDRHKHSISLFVTKSAFEASRELKTAAILTPTESGFTARKVSRFKPQCPIYAITHDKQVLRQLQVSWGVKPQFEENGYHSNHDCMVDALVHNIHSKGFIKDDDTVVVTSGHIMMEAGHTNMIEVYRVGHILSRCEKH